MVIAHTAVKASEVLPGDKIEVLLGDIHLKQLTVSGVTQGIIRGCVSINYTDGNWSEVPRDELVKIIREGTPA